MNQGTLKRCSVCGQERPLAEFCKDARNPEGLRYYCNGCNKINRDRQRTQNRGLVNSFKDVPCTDCGVRYPYYVMQFDHVRGEKSFTISQRMGRSPKHLLAEIAKCQVVCGNCHAERTHVRRVLSGEEDA